MPTTQTVYTQTSFSGGMNLIGDDTRIGTNQYRVAFNLRNRFDQLDEIQSSILVPSPFGVKQELVTFGNYLILFAGGGAYYKLYTDSVWTKIPDFQMSAVAPRYWTKAIPVSTTNYLRMAAQSNVIISLDSSGNPTYVNTPNSRGPINLNSVSGAAQGNLPGLLVQDNINQPWFIFIDAAGFPIARRTQKYNDWQITFTDAQNITVRNDDKPPNEGAYVPIGDKREYVPIGNFMEYTDGVLYITSPDGQFIYQSVTGRPLDFVRNVVNSLAGSNTNPPFTQYGGGDATTTSYSVGVGPISCLRAMADGSLFVAAGNANFSVFKDRSNNAPLQFGEFTLDRRFLFNAVCLSDRVIFDSIGDTRFISLGGVRSFNSIAQTQNEGRNEPFTATVQKAFGNNKKSIVQSPTLSAGILFNDYELYAVNTIFGPAILVYDTTIKCWSSFDIQQAGGKRIKCFAKIELTTIALFCITEDDNVYQLYAAETKDNASIRIKGMCSSEVSQYGNAILLPQQEVKLINARVVINEITKNAECEVIPYVNNRLSRGTVNKTITYEAPSTVDTSIYALDDVNTGVVNLFYNFDGVLQGYKTFCVINWSEGSITQFNAEMTNLSPQNPLNSQITTK